MIQSGKKSKRGSARMNASNTILQTPDVHVPVATVRPSTRKKQGNESVTTITESISMPSLSFSHESNRSLDINLAQKMFDSRASNISQFSNSDSTLMSLSKISVLSTGSGSSARRKHRTSWSPNLNSLNTTNFDFSNAVTPEVPREMFISALSNADNSFSEVVGVKRIFHPKENSPSSSYLDVKGVKKLLNPQPPTPAADYTRVEGIKNLFKQPSVPVDIKQMYEGNLAEPNYLNVKGVRRIKNANKPNSPDLAGVEILFESPKKSNEEQHYPRPVVKVSPMTRSSSSKIIDEVGSLGTEMATESERRTQRNIISEDVNTRHRRTVKFSMSNSNNSPETNSSSASLKKSRRNAGNEPLVSQNQLSNISTDVKSRGKNQELVNRHAEANVDNMLGSPSIPEEQNEHLENKPEYEKKSKKVIEQMQETTSKITLGKRKSNRILVNDQEPKDDSPKMAKSGKRDNLSTHSRRTRSGKELNLIENAEEVSSYSEQPLHQTRKTRGRSNKDTLAVSVALTQDNVSVFKSLDNTQTISMENSKIKSKTDQETIVAKEVNAIKLTGRPRRGQQKQESVEITKINETETILRNKKRSSEHRTESQSTEHNEIPDSHETVNVRSKRGKPKKLISTGPHPKNDNEKPSRSTRSTKGKTSQINEVMSSNVDQRPGLELCQETEARLPIKSRRNQKNNEPSSEIKESTSLRKSEKGQIEANIELVPPHNLDLKLSTRTKRGKQTLSVSHTSKKLEVQESLENNAIENEAQKNVEAHISERITDAKPLRKAVERKSKAVSSRRQNNEETVNNIEEVKLETIQSVAETRKGGKAQDLQENLEKTTTTKRRTGRRQHSSDPEEEKIIQDEEVPSRRLRTNPKSKNSPNKPSLKVTFNVYVEKFSISPGRGRVLRSRSYRNAVKQSSPEAVPEVKKKSLRKKSEDETVASKEETTKKRPTVTESSPKGRLASKRTKKSSSEEGSDVSTPESSKNKKSQDKSTKKSPTVKTKSAAKQKSTAKKTTIRSLSEKEEGEVEKETRVMESSDEKKSLKKASTTKKESTKKSRTVKTKSVAKLKPDKKITIRSSSEEEVEEKETRVRESSDEKKSLEKASTTKKESSKKSPTATVKTKSVAKLKAANKKTTKRSSLENVPEVKESSVKKKSLDKSKSNKKTLAKKSPTVKTQSVGRGKSANKRKSTTPVKSPPAKRVTRSRK